MGLTHLDLALLVLVFCALIHPTDSRDYHGRIENDLVIRREGGPHRVTGHLTVEPKVELTIEKGTELRFNPGVLLKVLGKLTAEGKELERIILTKQSGGRASDSPPLWPEDIRLANGSDIMEGVVQVKHMGTWKGICANSANWTAQDAAVVCRQLGFKAPLQDFFTYNFTATDYHQYIAITKPQCSGSESKLMDCPDANNLKYSSQICRDQRSLYLKCTGLGSNVATDHWQGIQFYNTTGVYRPTVQGDSLNESSSIMEYVDVLYAGVTDERLPSAAISASPYVPRFSNVRVMFSAYDAFNFSEINSTTVLKDCEAAYNRGHGLNVTTSLGRVRLTSSKFHHNFGNGIYTRTVDKVYRSWDWRNGDFCFDAPSTSYPQIYTGSAPPGSDNCFLEFETSRTRMLTISIMEMSIDPSVKGAQLLIYDGKCAHEGKCPTTQAPLLHTWDIQSLDSDTIGLPQAQVTTKSSVSIIFQLDKPYSTCPVLAECVKFVLYIASAEGPAEDVKFESVDSSENMFHGVLIENPRSFVYVANSNFSYNNYGAGLRIRGGASDVHMKDTSFTGNANSGLNITYSGGRRIMERITSTHNNGIGIYLDAIHEHKTRIERHQKTELITAVITDNAGIGLRNGNYCADSLLLLNASSVISRNRDQGVHVISCYGENSGMTNFSVEFSSFEANGWQAIFVSPMLSMEGIIKNVTFTGHQRGTLYIDNTDDLQRSRVFLDKRVDYAIESNRFENNAGAYVVYLRLTETTQNTQRLIFRYNRVLNNVVLMSRNGVKPRSRAPAVIIASSGNVFINRNSIINPESDLELSTHSTDTLAIINAMYNWFGSDIRIGDDVNRVKNLDAYYQRIFEKILDYEDRYNLAKIEYFPALESFDLKDSQGSRGTKHQRPFVTEVNGTTYLGGLMIENFDTEEGKHYVVQSDVNIGRGMQLNLARGTVLHFDNTVGMLVQGKLYAKGSDSQKIVLQRLTSAQMYPNITWMRLSGADNETEGVLEINSTGEWFTVCNKGWTMKEASVVCQQFGLTVQPETWRMERPPVTNSFQPIGMSQVSCDSGDTDIRMCSHDTEFNDCTHDDDVAIRCVEPTWAGIQITAAATQSELRHVTIREAGLLDSSTNEFVAALQIDNNHHLFSDLLITECSSTGMRIMYSNPFKGRATDITRINVIERSTFSNNLGDGLITKNTYLSLEQCQFINNQRAGLVYDPKMFHEDAFTIRKGIPVDSVINIDQNVPTNIKLTREGEVRYLQAMNIGSEERYTVLFQIQAAENNQRVTLRLLDYSPETNIEKLIIYDSSISNRANKNVKTVRIDEDVVDLPLSSSSNLLTLSYTINGVKSGRLTLAVSSVALGDVQEEKNEVQKAVRATLRLQDCLLTGNQRGMILTHYNNPSNEYMDLFIRHQYEQVILDNVTVSGNKEEAMFVPSVTKYNEIYMPNVEYLETPQRMANITYIITGSEFKNNGKGIHAEHNHVDYSNNMWRWFFINNIVRDNRYGGFYVELPLILNPYRNGNHSMEVNNSHFVNNKQFEFTVSGAFANLTMVRNEFRENVARTGLITLQGTEKKVHMVDNIIQNNRGSFMLEFDIRSHSEFGVYHKALVFRNIFRDNSPLEGTEYGTPLSGSLYTLTDYSIAVRGVQKVNITRNLLVDKLPFAFVADVPSTSLTTEVNVTENYWGTVDQSEIRNKVFDYNDWNNYARANFARFLTQDRFDSPVTSEAIEVVKFDLSVPLGGVIYDDLVIPYRSEPYSVISDVTVSSGVTMIIEPGVTFRMEPNIGFLILGRLVANGLSHKKIRFLPVERSQLTTPDRLKRQITAFDDNSTENIDSQELCRETSVQGLRLCGGENSKEGFIQLFNTTSNAWSLMCDPQFSYRTAQVLCRSIGFHDENVAVRYSELFEYFTYGRDRELYKDLWTRTFLCKGDESHMDQCPLRVNYNLLECSKRRAYVFIRCGDSNIDTTKFKYWGNIRFSTDTFEPVEKDLLSRSALRNVEIRGAGMLHGQRVSAVMSTYQAPSTYQLDIRNCAYGAIDFVSPRSDVFVLNSVMANNLGPAVNILVLNGETSAGLSQFKALNNSILPYRTFGLVNLCDAEKIIEIERRILVYYKYDYDAVDCVKVIRSKYKKKLGIRFLQLNLFQDDFSRNTVEVFDGPEFISSHRLVNMKRDSNDTAKRTLYKTTKFWNVVTNETQDQYQMGLHIHASPASGQHGFIAEITTDVSEYPGADGVHRVIGNTFRRNTGGSLHYSTVGETNPGIVVTGNLFRNNGLDVLNLTSAENVLIEAQNLASLSLSNNMFDANNGSVTIWLHAIGVDSKVVSGNVTNNIFMGTINGEALRIYGHRLQSIKVLFNYLTDNTVDNLNTVDIRGVIVNFTGNTMFKNMGAHGLDIWSDSDVTARQTVYKNQFYDNWPGDKFRETQLGGNNTMLYAAGIYKDITMNWFENKFFSELSTHNRTSAEKPWESPEQSLNARYNFWGHKIGVDNTPFVIQSRIHSYVEDYRLNNVTFEPFYPFNFSLMDGNEFGHCLVGWKLTASNKCMRYYGGLATFSQAKQICAIENSTIVKPRNLLWVEIGDVIQWFQQDYSDQVRAWVDEQESNRPLSKCSVIIDSRYDEASCFDLLPFVCESEQLGVPTPLDLLPLWVTLGVFLFLLLIAGVFGVVWCHKSKVRKEQRFERRASIRSSARSNKYAISNGVLTRASQTNLNTTVFGSTRTGLTSGQVTPRPRPRFGTEHSIALSGVTQAETDVDLYDTETVMTGKNGYTSTGYAGSIDSSRRNSRDDLSQISRPMLREPLHPTDREELTFRPVGLENPMYENEAYTTDHDNSPKHKGYVDEVPPVDPYADKRQQMYKQVRPKARENPYQPSAQDTTPYVNTSQLTRQLPKNSTPYVNTSQLNRGSVASRERLEYEPKESPTPAVRQNTRSYRPETPPVSYALRKPTSQDTLDTFDTQSTVTLDSEFSTTKPPPSYTYGSDYAKYYYTDDDKKPLETDIDSVHSMDRSEKASIYPASNRREARRQPLNRGRNHTDAYYNRQAFGPPPSYTSHLPPSYNQGNESNQQLEHASQYTPDTRYGHPAVETDIDAMSDRSSAWRAPRSAVERPLPTPAVETDIDAMSDTSGFYYQRDEPHETDF